MALVVENSTSVLRVTSSDPSNYLFPHSFKANSKFIDEHTWCAKTKKGVGITVSLLAT